MDEESRRRRRRRRIFRCGFRNEICLAEVFVAATTIMAKVAATVMERARGRKAKKRKAGR